MVINQVQGKNDKQSASRTTKRNSKNLIVDANKRFPYISSSLETHRYVGNQAVLGNSLRISQPNDTDELIAERMARRITQESPSARHTMTMESQRMGSGVPGQNIKRQKNAYPSPLSTANGHALSQEIREYMEPRFGMNFQQVQVHSDQQAHALAAQIQAKAFTFGNHIWLGRGASENDKHLMAHELAHIQQQNASNRPTNIIQRQVTELEPIVVTPSARQRQRILRSAGWRQVNVILTASNFRGEPMSGYMIYGDFRAPGVADQVEGGEITGGSISWSQVWLQPTGTIRILAARIGTPGLAPQGVSHYTLPTEGPLRLNAVQQKREVTVTAESSEEAAASVGASGTVGVDFEVVSLGGEVSTESSRTRGRRISQSWKVILPTSTFEVSVVR